MARFDQTTRKRTARFPSPGSSVSGTVVSLTDAAVPDFQDGRIVGPKFDVNGTVEMQTDLLIRTDDEREYVVHTFGGIAVAIGQALGGGDLNVGDHVTITYAADEEPEEGDNFPTKVYEAVVVKPKSAKSAKG